MNFRALNMPTKIEREGEAKRNVQEIFRVQVKFKNVEPRLLYPTRLLFKIEGEIKTFADKRKVKQLVTTKPVLQEMLKGLL